MDDSFGMSDTETMELQPVEDDGEPHSLWMLEKLRKIPAHFDELLSTRFEQHSLGTSAAIMRYKRLCTSIREYSCHHINFSLTDLVEDLVQTSMLHIPDDPHSLQLSSDARRRTSSNTKAKENLDRARILVFALLGWQSMLYIPMLNCRPYSEFYIDDVLEGFQSQAYANQVQDQSSAEYNLSDFLSGFGSFIPTDSVQSRSSGANQDVLRATDGLGAEGLNAFLLCSVGNIKLKWIDVLPPHLEFDKTTKTLFLFKYPSLCLGIVSRRKSKGMRQLIHSCIQRQMSIDEMDKLMIETLLSYRLLFGHKKRSRNCFKSLGPSDKLQDPLLLELCTSPRLSEISELVFTDRESYRVKRDLSNYRERLATLKSHVDRNKPKTLLGIWRDSRDSVQWWTFWALLVFGGLGIMLSFVQVVLQAAQLRLQGAQLKQGS